ncbi:unnamed protein product [Mytilus edulis]|uniref:Ig-like domain-containing protein n=1 Tax=Mytilus edulis TaxID=6550 RepID=A0A8S3TH14_MYTED|nr:unnamed protein product [Mytilus edulis]
MSAEQNSSLSNSNSNSDTTEHLNSGYEHPYTTLVANNDDEDEHVYDVSKQKSAIENILLSRNAASEPFVEIIEQDLSSDNIRTHFYANESQENVKLNDNVTEVIAKDNGSHPSSFLSKNIQHYRFVKTINIPAAEDISADSAHYIDIIEVNNALTTSQENNSQNNETNDTEAERIDIAQMSDEQNSSLSNSNSDTTEHLNSGYEHPYTTLVANNGDEDEHIYNVSKQNSAIENIHPSRNDAKFSYMKMWTRCALKIVMIFEAVFLIAESSKVKYSYFTVRQTVLLKCTDGALKLNSAVWAGPAQNGIRKGASVSVTEVDGKRSKWNVSQYTDDRRVLSSLLHRNRLTVTGSYDLQIVNTSTLDEGLYMCYLGPIEVFSRIILKIKTLPSNMTFANVTKEKILHGKENTTLHIICSVQDGIPDSLSIKRNNNTVKSGEDSSLEYILLPTRLDHGVKYTCEARSSLLKQPLKEIIHLDIKFLGSGIGLFVRKYTVVVLDTVIPIT